MKSKLTKLSLGTALLELKELGVIEIEISYSGGGDDGAIDDVELQYNLSGNRTRADRQLPEGWDEIKNELEEWTYERLGTEGDWVNNDGGEGTITIQVPSGEYTLNHGVRETHWTNSEGDLKEEKFFKED